MLVPHAKRWPLELDVPPGHLPCVGRRRVGYDGSETKRSRRRAARTVRATAPQVGTLETAAQGALGAARRASTIHRGALQNIHMALHDHTNAAHHAPMPHAWHEPSVLVSQ